jgi:hypothetical protein
VKVGRNDPCPCGSGKKYKNCCLIKERLSQAASNRYLPAEGSLRDKILLYMDQKRFDWDFEQARSLWRRSFGESPGWDGVEDVWFTVWFIHDYRLSFGKTLLELFYDEMRRTLGGLEAEILEEWLRTCLGVYEVSGVKEGSGVELTELFTGEKCFAYDVSASSFLVKWDIIIVRVFKVRDLNRLQGACLRFSRADKETLISLGEELFQRYRESRPGASWRRFMKEEGYRFNALQGVLKKKAAETKLLTVEGDELMFSHAVYRVKDFEEASRRLEKLEELIRVDEAEEGGGTQEIHYKWVTPKDEGDVKPERLERRGIVTSTTLKTQQGGDLRVLGDITVTLDELSIECLSERRLEKGKRMIQRALGGSAEHLYSEYQDPDTIMKERDKAAKARPEETMGHSVQPEVPEHVILEFLEDHYRKWMDMPNQSLKDLTPREASKTTEGRKLLKDLLKQAENIEMRRRKNGEVGYPVDKLRRELDMVEPALGVIKASSFYKRDSEKTKLNWLCYELALMIYDAVMGEPYEEFMRQIYDVEAVAEFSLLLSKSIGGGLARNPSGKPDKEYVVRTSKRFFPGLGGRGYRAMVRVVSEACEELLQECRVCPTRCLIEKSARCTMFDEGGFLHRF